jgi:hypothetical protein
VRLLLQIRGHEHRIEAAISRVYVNESVDDNSQKSVPQYVYYKFNIYNEEDRSYF